VRGKNVEDELGPVNYAATDTLFHITELPRRQILINNHKWNPEQIRLDPDFLEFSAPHESRRVEGIAHLQNAARDGCTGTLGQFA
jgi:hypothetical protein